LWIASKKIICACRALYGARGLKYKSRAVTPYKFKSRPVWGAWIEIKILMLKFSITMSRPVWGAWIEIFHLAADMVLNRRRALYGARGLKLILLLIPSIMWKSRPVWGAWIEMFRTS